MPENIWFVAAIWMAMAFIASLVSIQTGISVALIETFYWLRLRSPPHE